MNLFWGRILQVIFPSLPKQLNTKWWQIRAKKVFNSSHTGNQEIITRRNWKVTNNESFDFRFHKTRTHCKHHCI